ncbi:hypothetical protein AQUCO_04300010v1 [Aquilegia coerulea]|uniref:Beta-carotene isomerase D27-like C-terminal domain-containing protein n=1 Tax=Aquilegia coerulea TaxID=218851 RepID=A0A2G5CNB5_AQUCA|nr:hypothetical protein AQUCO_04300010v1 [Aquilegia coerulea]
MMMMMMKPYNNTIHLLGHLNSSLPFPHKFNYVKHYYCVRSQSEVGWDSDKPGYDGLIEVANQLMVKTPNNAETVEASVRILRSLFPPFLLELFKMLVAPLGRGKVAAIMVARVTALSCQWLMGSCKVNSIVLPDGSTWKTGVMILSSSFEFILKLYFYTVCTNGFIQVLVEKCKYLEESKCVGICINTCKLPTQAFINDYMGVPLVMEPDFSDYSCQFKFGVHPPINEEDKTLSEPCLAICPTATRRRELRTANELQCPKL